MKKPKEKVYYKKFISTPSTTDEKEIRLARLIVYGNAYVYLYDKLDKVIEIVETIYPLPSLLNIKTCYVELLVKLKE